MWTYQSAMVFWAVLAAFPLMTSVFYFLASPKEASMAQRIGASAHGFFIALLHLAVVYIGAAQLHADKFGTPLAVLCAVAAVLIAYSFWAFRGSKAVHFLQAVNIIWLLGLLSLGGMAVTGRWL